MHIRKVNLFTLIFGLFLFSPFMAFSFVYQPPAPLYVKTQALPPTGETVKPSHRIWRIISKKGGEPQSMQVSFFAIESAPAFCYINLSDAGRILDANLPGGAGNILQTPDFLFASGYPAPCDIFPRTMLASGSLEASESYKVRRDIGGERFADEICIRVLPVSIDEAADNGWIKEAAQEGVSSLRVVKAVNCRSGRLISLQVWPEGATWWIYEETPYRRSWQVENVND